MHDAIHPEPTSFWTKFVFARDHKVIAKQFLWFGLAFLAIGGAMALIIRWQLSNPGEKVPLLGDLLFGESGGRVGPSTYTSLFTMHGTIMIFFAVTPILIGAFGNYCIPLMIGARDMAFPTLNMLSFWTQMLAGLVLVVSFFVPGGAANAGWTAYPPLSTPVGTEHLGQTLWVLALLLAGTSTLMGAINYTTTVIRLRAPGMGYFKMPLTVWGLWLTAILNVLFVPVIASALLLLLLDRAFGTSFFIAGMASGGKGGDPVIYQHLFWIFGHPEVYILILPAWGVVSDLLSFFSRKPAFGYKATALAMSAITALSGVVWGHHMFTVGLSPLLSQAFMMLTMLISIPSAIFFLNWLGTLWKGALRFTTPMLFALGVVVVFSLGGLTGLYLASTSMDIYLHDTYFVVGHFHLTMAASVLFGSFAAIYFWFPKMFGKQMNRALGVVHFVFSLLPVLAVFGIMMAIGFAGMQRRLYDPSVYEFLRHLKPLNDAITWGAYVLGLGQIPFVVNFFWSLARGRKAADNPWEVTTLEWQIPSPPPHYNYAEIPKVLHGPHEFSHPDVKDKDWLAQNEPLPGTRGGEAAA